MNDAQIEYWNGPAAARWTQRQSVLDGALQVFGSAALARAAPRLGEQVLDVGCGCGDSTLALAQAVGPSGGVTGVDVSAPMLARAAERAAACKQVRLVQADAAALAFDRAFDLIFSRFGVMFFADPRLAFTHLRSGLRPLGRLAFVCWRALAENPWSCVPAQVVRRVWSDAPAMPPEDAPGPYAFADRTKLTALLQAAGFEAISIERFDADVLLSTDGLDDAVSFTIEAGPAARLLAGASPEIHTRVRAEMAHTLAPHRSAAGFALAGSSWLVTARAAG